MRFENLCLLNKTARVTSVALAAIAITCGALLAASILPSTALCLGGLTAGAVATLARLVCHVSSKARSAYLEPQSSERVEERSPYLRSTETKVASFPICHCGETDRWRKKLIQAARHHVVLSGNYCGERAFDEVLDILERKLEDNPEFTAVILSAPNFIKDAPKKGYANVRKLRALEQRFPERFSLVTTGSITHVGAGGIKLSTNHTKALVIDYGKYFILGGSGVKDNFSKEAVDNPLSLLTSQSPFLSKPLPVQMMQAELSLSRLIQKCTRAGRNAPACVYEMMRIIRSPQLRASYTKEQLRTVHVKIDTAFQRAFSGESLFSLAEYSLAGDAMKAISGLFNSLQSSCAGGSLADYFIPGNFRDMDFVFADRSGSHSQGRLLYLQLLALAHRWEHLNATRGERPYTPELHRMPAFTGRLDCETAPKSLVEKMLARPIPSQRQITTTIPDFQEHSCVSSEGKIRLFCSGPEHTSSALTKAIACRIDNARSEIIINHMYFNRPEEIMVALRNAAARGVAITICTNDEYKGCPNSHTLFGPNNMTVISELLSQLSEAHRRNVSVYMYRQQKKGLHKKVLVIDRKYVIAGSSNFGYKSLTTTADHEINFILRSPKAAEETCAICDEDRRYSVMQEKAHTVAYMTAARSYFYRLFAFVWG